MLSKLVKSACSGALRLNGSRLAARPAMATLRSFASASPAMAKLSKGLGSELQFEQENYAKPEEVSKLPKEWKLAEKAGDVNLSISREVGNKTVTIEWQLVTPFNEELDGFDAEDGKPGAAEKKDAEDPELPPESTDFTITVENTKTAAAAESKAAVSEGGDRTGVMFFCSTQVGEGHRYIIGNVKSYTSEVERDSMSSYNGPEFDDLEEKLQEAMDEYLGEVGIDGAICDFIDASSVDKEHREYMRWLENVKQFMGTSA